MAELAAGDATNKEIAGALFLSVKTVEANLSRVYRSSACAPGPSSLRAWPKPARFRSERKYLRSLAMG